MHSLLDQILNNWIDFLSMIATVSAASYGIYAISSWRHQKDFEMKIEIFAMSRRALDLVKYLRSPFSWSGEINPEVMNKWFNVNDNKLLNRYQSQLVIFQSRLKLHDQTYKELLELRERAWAHFGPDHIYFRFYDLVLSTIIGVANAHAERIELSNTDEFPAEEYKEERKLLNKKVVSLTGDEINTNLEKMFDELIKTRKRIKST